MATLKLYIWDDFMPDYNSGLAVAIAPDIRSARRAVAATWDAPSSESLKHELSKRPKVIPVTEAVPAQAWQVSGGS